MRIADSSTPHIGSIDSPPAIAGSRPVLGRGLTNVTSIAISRTDTRHDKIPQRMQIMMYQGVDRRNIKLMVQEHETFS